MQYGLMTYDYKNHFNAGDYIQSLAARQFLPRVDRFINREGLMEYTGPETRLIMNGWFLHNHKSWPPSPNIVPLFISFHLHDKAAKVVLSEEGVSYLQKFEVGVRDYSTLNLLKSKGINAFFSGCLTLTLGETYQHKKGTDVYFVDVLHDIIHNPFFLVRRKRILRELFGDEVSRSAKWIRHNYPSRQYKTEDSRFQLAESLLKRYQNARLVVTSRLHCALPCLAMGTPVVYVDGGVSSDRDRFEGLDRFVHTIRLSDRKSKTKLDVSSIQNKNHHLEYVELLKQRCREFVRCPD